MRWPLHLLRGVHNVAILALFTYALKELGLAEAYTLFFIAPLLITALSTVVLGQQRLWLHAWQPTVPHPVMGVAMVFDSGLQWPAWNTSSAATANAVQADDSTMAPTADWQRLLTRLPREAPTVAR